MDYQTEDYQLLLSKVINILGSNWELGVALIIGQSIDINSIDLTKFIDAHIRPDFEFKGLRILAMDDLYVRVRTINGFYGKRFDKKLRSRKSNYGMHSNYTLVEFKQRMQNYIYSSLKKDVNERLKETS